MQDVNLNMLFFAWPVIKHNVQLQCGCGCVRPRVYFTKRQKILFCFAALTTGRDSETLPTDWGEKHPDGRVWESYPAERRRDNPSEREFIKVRNCIHNCTIWTKLEFCGDKSHLYFTHILNRGLILGTLKHILLKCKTAWIILVIGGFCVCVQVWRWSGCGPEGLPGDERKSTAAHAGQTDNWSTNSCRARRPLPHQNQFGGATGRTHQVRTLHLGFAWYLFSLFSLFSSYVCSDSSDQIVPNSFCLMSSVV